MNRRHAVSVSLDVRISLRGALFILIVTAVSVAAVGGWRDRDWRRGQSSAQRLWDAGLPTWRWCGTEWDLVEVEPPFPLDQPDFAGGFRSRMQRLGLARPLPPRPANDALETRNEMLRLLLFHQSLPDTDGRRISVADGVITARWPTGETVGIWVQAEAVSVVGREDGRLLIGQWSRHRLHSMWNLSRSGILQRFSVLWCSRCYQCTDLHVHGD